ncbi:RNA polymerase sigma factor [Hephaestia sp. GCM10023244]|uniref:RNA polymerase sigma factor n=1 Tax=unclassified Hephaestia TaxID=2631281 RepID=UPI0020772912|nr:sigma-70 family RNA polymerase sigma factor [Hephaestia sp. MAHUQ-44]
MNVDPELPSLFEHHRAELLRFVTARTGDVAEAEDILQELWLRAGAAPAATVEHWRAYLFRSANNLIIDRVRARRRRELRDRTWTESLHGVAFGMTEIVDPADAPDHAIEADQEARRLAAAIAALPAGARRVFELHKVDGLSHTEVAARLRISRSGVEKHMAVAMKHLRRALAD